MSEELNPADQQAENADENLNSNNEGEKETQETEESQAVEAQKGDDVKKEESPYKAQLEKLNAEIAKKDDIISKKNRALEAEKERRKEAEKAREAEIDNDKSLSKSDREALKEELRAEFRFDSLLASATTDKVEQEVIRKVYDLKIVKSGDVQEDFKNALAIARRDVMAAQLEQQAQREREESELSFYQSSDIRGSNPQEQDPVKRMAASILRSLGQDKAIKNLK